MDLINVLPGPPAGWPLGFGARGPQRFVRISSNFQFPNHSRQSNLLLCQIHPLTEKKEINLKIFVLLHLQISTRQYTNLNLNVNLN